MASCPQSVIPDIIEDPCGGEQSNTNCVIHEAAISYLSLPPNTILTVVLQAYLQSLISANNRITVLEAQAANFETRITALENA